MTNAETRTADPLTTEGVYMEVINWKFFLNCTKVFLNTCSIFSNFSVMKTDFTHEKRIRFYMAFLDGFTYIM